MSLQMTSEEDFTHVRRRLRSPRDAAAWLQTCPEITAREWLVAVFVDRQWGVVGLHLLGHGDACPIDPLPRVPGLIDAASGYQARRFFTGRQHAHPWSNPGVDAARNIAWMRAAVAQAGLIWEMNLILDPSGLVWTMVWDQDGGGRSGTSGVSGWTSWPY